MKRLHDGKVNWIIVGPAEGPAGVTGGMNFNLIEVSNVLYSVIDVSHNSAGINVTTAIHSS